jgi:hypothetical protein
LRSLLAFDLPSDPTTVANLLEHVSWQVGGRDFILSARRGEAREEEEGVAAMRGGR